jgi:hypothetical protein
MRDVVYSINTNIFHADRSVYFSEYCFDCVSDFKHLTAIARKLFAKKDPISQYLWDKCPAEVHDFLAKLSASKDDLEWERANVADRIETLKFTNFINEVLHDKKLRLLFLHLNECMTIRRLATAATTLPFARANRAVLAEVYACDRTSPSKPRCVTLDLSDYLPLDYWTIVDDIIEARGNSYPIAEELLKLGEKTLMAFPKGRVIKIEPCPVTIGLNGDDLLFFGVTREQAERGLEYEELKMKRKPHEIYDRFHVGQFMELIQDAHEKMLEFIAAILEARNKAAVTEFIIYGDSNDVKITTAGRTVELTPARKRALICLALLAEKEMFSVDEFSELYVKKGPKGEARKEFDQAMRALREQVPGIFFDENHSGGRRFRGFTLNVLAKPEDLLANLVRLRGQK